MTRANEFNLSVYDQDELTPLETFENLSMVPSAPNFVETVTSASKFIRVAVNEANTNVTGRHQPRCCSTTAVARP